MHAPPKRCPQCGEEYLDTAQMCADCGVALVTEADAAAAADAASAHSAADLPPPAEMAVLRTADPAWIRALSDGLDAAGIAHRVEIVMAPGSEGRARTADAMRCTIFVLHEDVAEATRVDAEVAREVIPDLQGAPAAAGTELEHCPACGAALDAHAAECGDCGLVFATEP